MRHVSMHMVLDVVSDACEVNVRMYPSTPVLLRTKLASRSLLWGVQLASIVEACVRAGASAREREREREENRVFA
jgi:hypothetical protein